MVFHWSLYDKPSQVSRTLLSILADPNNAVVRMVSTRPLISKSSNSCINPLMTVPKAPITIGIPVTFMFKSFFNSLSTSRYLFFFLLPFNFTPLSAGTAKSTILQVLIFLLIILLFHSFRVFHFRVSCCWNSSSHLVSGWAIQVTRLH